VRPNEFAAKYLAPTSRLARFSLRGRPAAIEDAGPRSLSMFASSLGLVAAKVAAMGLGFLFWLLAARLFLPSDVGLATGVVSAVMLCTQIALLGVGSAVIVHFPRHAAGASQLLDTAFTVSIASGLVAAGLFQLLALAAFPELRIVASGPAFIVAFIAMGILGTVGMLLDQISAALRRGDQALTRAVVFGVATVGLLAGVAATSTTGAFAIFIPWVGAASLAFIVGLVQLRRSLSRYRYRARLEPRLTRSLLIVGLPNHMLTLAERAPGLILPIVVTELVSPEANAAWYAAWMMAWLVYFIPVQVGMTLFAEAAHRPGELGDLVRHATRITLALGVPAAAALALAAHVALSILGPVYADAGTTPLRILVVAVLPLTLIQAYFIVCRATGRLGEATVAGVVNGLVSIVAAVLAAAQFGLPAVAIAWVAAQVLTSVWALLRLSWLRPSGQSARASERAAARVPPEAAVVAPPPSGP
jgi:O-antigen/teichoic acid export membrane protein